MARKVNPKTTAPTPPAPPIAPQERQVAEPYSFRVVDADIWVGEVQPAAPLPDDFWFDTTAVPLFGITIIGSLPGAGPPSPVNPPDGTADNPDPGDAWWDSDGGLWVWDGDSWEYQGNFRGPTGPTGPSGETELPPGALPGQILVWGATGPMWVDPAVLFPQLSTWPLTANWVPDSSVLP